MYNQNQYAYTNYSAEEEYIVEMNRLRIIAQKRAIAAGDAAYAAYLALQRQIHLEEEAENMEAIRQGWYAMA